MIKPTIGRVVLVNRFSHGARFSPQPEPALICRVWHDRMINVGGFDANGQPFSLVSVQLLQDDDAAPSMANGAYAEWMPYQKAVADDAAQLAMLRDKAANLSAESLANSSFTTGISTPAPGGLGENSAEPPISITDPEMEPE